MPRRVPSPGTVVNEHKIDRSAILKYRRRHSGTRKILDDDDDDDRRRHFRPPRCIRLGTRGEVDDGYGHGSLLCRLQCLYASVTERRHSRETEPIFARLPRVARAPSFFRSVTFAGIQFQVSSVSPCTLGICSMRLGGVSRRIYGVSRGNSHSRLI